MYKPPKFGAKQAPNKWRKQMTISFKTLSAAALSLALVLPVSATISSDAMALTKKQAKKCHIYASKKAKKKTNNAALTGLVLGGVGGALIGDAFGGKKTTILSGAGGAAAGLAVGGSKYDYYYDKYFESCAAQYEDDDY